MNFAIIAVALATRTALAAHVVHVPPAEATAGTAIELVVEAPAETPTLRVFYRAHATAVAFTSKELVRKDVGHWVVVVPPAAVTTPGVDYYIAAGDVPVFASAAAPYAMPVVVTDETARRDRDLQRADRRRSRVATAFEWVDFGRTNDRYYRVDADFAYRLWAYPLEELRVGYTRLLGADGGNGFKVGGWFELGLAAVEGVRFDGRVMVMATQSGFAPGLRGELRLGDRDQSHLALGVEYLADVGTNGFFRLGWGTVPGFPMSATVEISTLPADDREAGVRLYYDIARVLHPGIRLGVRVGYAARNQDTFGFTSGGNLLVDF